MVIGIQRVGELRITQGKALYETGVQNSQIAANGDAWFLTNQTDLENKQKFGSFNNLEIINNSTSKVNIDLDGLSTRRRILFGNSTLVIKPDEGIFFDTFKLTEIDGAIISADEIALIARIVR